MTSVIASEKATNKPLNYESIKELRAFLDNLEKERLQRQHTAGSNLQHGGKADVNQNGELLTNHDQEQKIQPFGRGSSGEKAKL